MNENEETRQERREKRLKKKHEKMPQHGKGLAKIYRNAVTKRVKKKS
ncbi:MAG: hypothetical protein V1767_09805 [Chloroflexota bacterium]